jgi:tetratricopeptide (TPR) repeat protein
MRQLLFTLTIATMTTFSNATAQQSDFVKVKNMELQLEGVMELIDTAKIKIKLKEVEESYKSDPTEINKARLGIVYHEVALNLSFLSKSEFKGYAKKSFDVLTDLFTSPSTTPELMPFIAAYRASALSLASAETKKLKLLGTAFKEFQSAVEKYGSVSYCPEFMRGSVAENMPWFFFSKAKFAKIDFQSIIRKQEKNRDYANWKIMSFTYWAWAKQHQSNKYRKQAITYLDKAIELDPNYEGGRKKAEDLKLKLMK